MAFLRNALFRNLFLQNNKCMSFVPKYVDKRTLTEHFGRFLESDNKLRPELRTYDYKTFIDDMYYTFNIYGTDEDEWFRLQLMDTKYVSEEDYKLHNFVKHDIRFDSTDTKGKHSFESILINGLKYTDRQTGSLSDCTHKGLQKVVKRLNRLLIKDKRFVKKAEESKKYENLVQDLVMELFDNRQTPFIYDPFDMFMKPSLYYEEKGQTKSSFPDRVVKQNDLFKMVIECKTGWTSLLADKRQTHMKTMVAAANNAKLIKADHRMFSLLLRSTRFYFSFYEFPIKYFQDLTTKRPTVAIKYVDIDNNGIGYDFVDPIDRQHIVDILERIAGYSDQHFCC
ncbi:uncharacterized protein LOC128957664 [Oppia nitens]|uniref:uncharacterized protein LOC128957664 n=1 Tax=Oppia nitens TaxID=1686743 RepID=UPI0023DB80DB|nr:uncharacterized protein LOC128957664 [Oppia nitens]